MRRVVAIAAAASLLAAAPAAVEAKPKPVRFAAKCTAKTKRAPCRTSRRAKGWRPARGPVASRPAPAPFVEQIEVAPVAPAGTVAAAPADGPAPPGEPPPPAPLCDPSPWLGAIAEDVDGFRLRLTRTCVPEGTVLFQFRNNDLAFHNLWAEGTDPSRAKRQVVADTPGETVVTASAQLAAGEWRLYCSLPGHEAMTRLVDVTPAG
jgi:hypothetical protein